MLKMPYYHSNFENIYTRKKIFSLRVLKSIHIRIHDYNASCFKDIFAKLLSLFSNTLRHYDFENRCRTNVLQKRMSCTLHFYWNIQEILCKIKFGVNINLSQNVVPIFISTTKHLFLNKLWTLIKC